MTVRDIFVFYAQVNCRRLQQFVARYCAAASPASECEHGSELAQLVKLGR